MNPRQPAKRTRIIMVGAVVAGAVLMGLAWRLRDQYLRQHPDAAISSRTVMAVGRSLGFAMNSPAEMRRSGEERYGFDHLSPAKRRECFLSLLHVEGVPFYSKAILALPESYQREVITGAADWLARYRAEMTDEERDQLRSFLQSPQGRTTVERAKQHYLTKFSPEEVTALAPVIDGIVSTLDGIL